MTTSGLAADFALTAGAQPEGIASGSDGNLWIAEYGSAKIAKMTTGGALVSETAIPTTASQPDGITAGPVGNIWFSEYATNKVTRLTTGGTFTEYTVPTASSQPWAVAPGPDGNLWFTESGGDKIGVVNAGTGFVTQVVNAGTLSISAPGSLNLGSLTPGTQVGPTALGTLTFTDTLGDGGTLGNAPWNVQLAATDLYNTVAAKTGVPFSKMTITVDQSPTGGAGVTPGLSPQTLGGPDGTPGASYSTPMTLVTGSSAGGTWSMANNKITMTVLGTAPAGSYSSTIQYTITG